MEDKREKKSRMGQKHFGRHLDTTKSSLEMKVLKQSTVDRQSYSYFTHRFMVYTRIRKHTLLISLHTLLIRYANSVKRYTDRPLLKARV